MRTRPLGKTDLVVSELALGTWGLSGDGYGPVPEPEQDKVIDRALALGIALFETADSYGRGAMEKKLGERLPDDGTVRIITKIGTDRTKKPPMKCFEPAYLSETFEKSRERLKRSTIDAVLLHNPVEATVTAGEATALLAELKAKGALRAWGVSAGTPGVARAAIEKGADVVSMTYHALFSSDLRSLHEDIAKHGTGVLAHSVLGHGLLAGYWSLHKEFPGYDHRSERWTSDDLRRRVQNTSALRALVGDAAPTMRGAAIRFALANDDVSAVLLGPKNAVQLDMLVRDAGKEPPYLTPEQLGKLALRLEHLGIKT
jgi:aryl-alcohol dehydrogenase-like predicted oxidoreductase